MKEIIENHWYAVMPNGEESYMVEWCSKVEGGWCRVPACGTDSIRLGCNETREDAIAKAMALAGNDYPVAVYKRASLDMSTDDYWKFSLDYVA